MEEEDPEAQGSMSEQERVRLALIDAQERSQLLEGELAETRKRAALAPREGRSTRHPWPLLLLGGVMVGWLVAWWVMPWFRALQPTDSASTGSIRLPGVNHPDGLGTPPINVPPTGRR